VALAGRARILRIDSYSVLLELARVLRVDITDLTAAEQPTGPAADSGVQRRTSVVERALLAGGPDALAGDLRAAVWSAHADYQGARYDAVLDRLPQLIAALDTQPAADVLAAGYTVVAKVLTKIGAVDRLPMGLSSRRVQVQVDLAWAHAQRRRDADALVALLEVERAAPQAAHRNVVARDTIRRLLARARGSTGPAVRGLADRAGVVL
jgi:hypothetical protein